MKSSASKDYLYLLRCALWDERPEMDVLDDWNGVLKLAQEQTTLGLVGHAALQTEAVRQLLPESRQRLQQQVDKMMGNSKHSEALIARLVQSFEGEGINVVLLKGQGVAAFYPAPTLRHFGDVDLFVSPADYDQAVANLNRMADAKAVKKAYTTDKHYHISIDNICVELHRRCMTLDQPDDDRIYQDFEARGMSGGYDECVINGINVKRPEVTFNAFYVFLHLWEHFLERGIGLRQVCDLTMLLHSRCQQVDRDRLRQMLEALRLMRPWQLLGSLLVSQLGLPANEMPFHEPRRYNRKALRLMRIILKEGNFGRSMTLRQQHTRQQGKARRWTTLLSIQVRSWRIFTLLPDVGWRLWKTKMKGGISK